MPRRDRQQLLGLAGLLVALVALTLTGFSSDVLLAGPVLLLALPLLAGRYVGAERLARLACRFAPARRRSLATPPATARPAALIGVPRGGRLIAASLAVRPPPAALTA